MLPSTLFEANSQPTFPHDKRDLGVYFPYSEAIQDAVRYTLPPGFTVEAAPTNELAKFEKLAAYSLTSSQAANTITVRRDLILGDVYFPVADYPQLRTFSGQSALVIVGRAHFLYMPAEQRDGKGEHERQRGCLEELGEHHAVQGSKR